MLPPPERAVPALAAGQHGVVSRDQLLAVGLTARMIEGRLAKGWLVPVHQGVYVVGGRRLDLLGRAMAATLARGPGAYVSHLAAARVWRIVSAEPVVIDVVVARGRGNRGGGGVVIHRSSRLTGADVTRKQSIPVTRPARTLIDIASVLTRFRLDQALHETERLGLASPEQIRAAIGRHSGHRGAARLASALAAHDHGGGATASELEVRFLQLCHERGITRPLTNKRLGPYKTDFRWPHHRLIVETDGRSHLTRRNRERDVERDAEHTVLGWRTLRFTWKQLAERADWVEMTVRQALALGPPSYNL